MRRGTLGVTLGLSIGIADVLLMLPFLSAVTLFGELAENRTRCGVNRDLSEHLDAFGIKASPQ